MQRRNAWIIIAILLLAVGTIVPWQQAQTNGTGDGILYSTFRGYGFLFSPPTVDYSLSTITNTRTWVQLDSNTIAIELLLLAAIAAVLLVISGQDGKNLSAVQKATRGLVTIGILFFLSIFGMGFVSYGTAEMDFWTIHTHKVIEELQDALSTLQDVETGERGYLLTGAPEFLQPFRAGSSQATKHIEQVKTLTEDNPRQQQEVKRLSQLAQEKIEQAKENIASINHGDPLKYLPEQRQGQRVMDAFRAEVNLMIGNEVTLLQYRVARLHFTQYATAAIIGVLSVAAIAMMVWVFRITRTAIEEEQSRIRDLNVEIEQRKRVEKVLKETAVSLSRSNADLQQFAYVASHDLQEPLRAVSGFLTLLTKKLGDSLDADSRKYIDHAVEGAQRMRTLVNDLLVYARVESRAKEPKPEPLSKILEQVKSDLSVQIAETSTSITSDNLPIVVCDGTQIRQLFQNLIANAIKFRGTSTPKIVIRSNRVDEGWLFAFEDNGRGFDMEHAERIFIIFQRLQGREEAPGTGIGLALCKKIVERHNGRIWVESKPGQGSTFFFTLPLPETN